VSARAREHEAGAVLRLLLLLSACAPLAGCSFLFVSGPPAQHERLHYFDCSSSAAAPVADGTWAAIEGLFAVGLASADGDTDSEGNKLNTTSAVALFGVLAAVHAGSMVYGLVQGNRCGDAKQHLQQRIAESEANSKSQIEALQRELAAERAKPPAPMILVPEDQAGAETPATAGSSEPAVATPTAPSEPQPPEPPAATPPAAPAAPAPAPAPRP
jgi:hypothetical protein